MSNQPDHAASAIVVIGVGGCGCNIVQQMAEAAKNDRTGTGCDFRFVLANTASQALKPDCGIASILLGVGATKALGACGNPDIGRQAAEESREAITAAMQGAPAIFMVAGMGGGTGTGASPVIVNIAKALRIPLAAIVTRPFPFEGKGRMAIADEGIASLGREAITLVVIPNGIILEQMPRHATMLQAFRAVNDYAWTIVQAGWPQQAIWQSLPITAIVRMEVSTMATMNISLPDPMKIWVEDQVNTGHYSNASDYMRDLIRRDQTVQREREALIQALVAGENSGISEHSVDSVWQGVKSRRGLDV